MWSASHTHAGVLIRSHMAPCSGPCPKHGHLSPLTVWVGSPRTWEPWSHLPVRGSPPRFSKALTFPRGFLLNSPAAVWMPCSPGSGCHTTYLATSLWDAFLSQFYLLPLARLPSLWSPVLASCTWPASSPLTAPLSYADAFPPFSGFTPCSRPWQLLQCTRTPGQMSTLLSSLKALELNSSWK